jgi:ribosome biogenesis GTPase / thiamine phosphate phosphatase
LILPDDLQHGLVIANHGRHIWIETLEGDRLLCHPRGKKSQAVVGDRVQWQVSGDEGSIVEIESRRNILYRQDEVRTKLFAANIDQVLILLAAEPEFSESQLSRALIAAEGQEITALIALNKSDLKLPFAAAWDRLKPYRDMGYTVLPMALKPSSLMAIDTHNQVWLDETEASLQLQLSGKITLILGPSGAGKSTLINRLIPTASALTAEISKALNAGKHTTSSTTWYWLDRPLSTALIDSPGFQEFGLRHLDPMHLAHLMPDISPWIKHCKFYNCTHLHEPGCGVMPRVGTTENGAGISVGRYRFYTDLFRELSETRY